MLKEGKIYRLTEEGRRAWESQDVAIPAEYRRILWLIETEAHVDVVRGCLREYPDDLLDEWLDELEELDLLQSKQAVVEYDLDLSAASAQARALVEEDTVRLDRAALEVGGKLSRDPLGSPELKCTTDTRFHARGRAIGVRLRGGRTVHPAAWMSLSGLPQARPDRDTRGYFDARGHRVWLDVF